MRIARTSLLFVSEFGKTEHMTTWHNHCLIRPKRPGEGQHTMSIARDHTSTVRRPPSAHFQPRFALCSQFQASGIPSTTAHRAPPCRHVVSCPGGVNRCLLNDRISIPFGLVCWAESLRPKSTWCEVLIDHLSHLAVRMGVGAAHGSALVLKQLQVIISNAQECGQLTCTHLYFSPSSVTCLLHSSMTRRISGTDIKGRVTLVFG